MTTDFAESLAPYEQAARSLQGWRFEYEPEIIGGEVPWHYESLANDLSQSATRIADLGTGGGESFQEILSGSNGDAFATEEWHRNAPVAANRLASQAPVVRCSSLHLPFRDSSFDLVLARHEAIDPAEVARVLVSHGVFLSQQVVHDFMSELKTVFPETVVFENFFEDYQQQFSALGLRITRAEAFRYKIRFTELGPLVYQLVAAPWTIPGFSIESHYDGLLKLQDQLEKHGELLFTAGYYLLQVRSSGE